MHPAYIGAIAGSVIGILGGIFGTWCSIASTRGPRERSFMTWAAVGTWIGCGAFVAGILLIPSPINYWLWLPYAVLLPLSIVWMNRRLTRIRAEEAGREE